MRNRLQLFLIAALALGTALLTPPAAQAQQYRVGDRVAMPAGYGDKWLDAIIIRIDPSNATFPYRVHPLGYTPYADANLMAKQLRPYGSVPTEPIGGIANDPYLLQVQGKTAFRPNHILPGVYECYAFSGGRLEPRPGLNFVIMEGGQYRSGGGSFGRYDFDPASGRVSFQHGGLDGQTGKYEQASNPPARKQPPSITLTRSGDSCDLRL